jgi:hypothetical protein
MLTDDDHPNIGNPTLAMIALARFHKDKIGEKRYWRPRPKPKTPMKQLYEYGDKEVGCCADKEK